MPFDVHESQTLKIPVNEMSNTHHTKPQPPGPAEESAHLPAEPSPLSPDSTIHIYGKGGERKEYIFRGLYNSSFAHQSLSFPSPPPFRDGSYSSSPSHRCAINIANRREGFGNADAPQDKPREDPATTQHSPYPHELPPDTTTI